MNKEIALHNRWLGGELLNGVRFMMNDYVAVLSGKYQGESGSVVAVVNFEANTVYLVETESGKDIAVTESEIEIAKASPISDDHPNL